MGAPEQWPQPQGTMSVSKVQSCGPSDRASCGMDPMQSPWRPFRQNQHTVWDPSAHSIASPCRVPVMNMTMRPAAGSAAGRFTLKKRRGSPAAAVWPPARGGPDAGGSKTVRVCFGRAGRMLRGGVALHVLRHPDLAADPAGPWFYDVICRCFIHRVSSAM